MEYNARAIGSDAKLTNCDKNKNENKKRKIKNARGREKNTDFCALPKGLVQKINSKNFKSLQDDTSQRSW
jgi:hypothetical protein